MSDSREKFEAWWLGYGNAWDTEGGEDDAYKIWQAAEQSRQPEIDALKAEINRLKTVPMKYRRMEFNAQLQAEIAALKQRIADAEKQEPFGWVYCEIGKMPDFHYKNNGVHNGMLPVYAHPPIPPDVAELQTKSQCSHAELLAIHNIGMCIAECPPILDSDTMTVKMVKEMAIRINSFAKFPNVDAMRMCMIETADENDHLKVKLSASEADVKMLCKGLEFYANPEVYKPDSLGRVESITYVAQEALATVRARKETKDEHITGGV